MPSKFDFGLANVIEDNYDFNLLVLAKPFYEAPECFMDDDEAYGVSVDVYSYAFLLYMLMVNQLGHHNNM